MIRNDMITQLPTEPIRQDSAARLQICFASFFHFATLGAALPLLPLFLLRSTGLTWLETGIALAAFPVALIVSPEIQRLARAAMLTAANGFAISHLAAAGLSMGFAMWCQRTEFEQLDSRLVMLWLFAYAIVLTPSFAWLNEVATPEPDTADSSVAWRLWGAVGFVLPAWLSEGVLAGFANYQEAVISHQVLPVLAGWTGIAATAAALLIRGDVSSADRVVTPEGTDSAVRPGFLLAAGIGLVVASQRCHWLWTAPFFAAALRSHVDASPLIHRLIVVSQVFEIAVIPAMYCLVARFPVKRILLAGTCLWIARSALLGWTAQTTLPGQWQLAGLFTAQLLQGVAVGSWFAVLGLVLRLDSGFGNTTGLTRLIGFSGIAGCVFGGAVTGVLAGQLGSVDPGRLPGELSLGVFTLQLGGWGGIWWFSLIPGVVAVVAIAAARFPEISPALPAAPNGWPDESIAAGRAVRQQSPADRTPARL